jgi:hypothetical protein
MKLFSKEAASRRNQTRQNSERRAEEVHQAITRRLLLLLGCLRLHPTEDCVAEVISRDRLPDWMTRADKELLVFLVSVWASGVADLVPEGGDVGRTEEVVRYITEELMTMRPLSRSERAGLGAALKERGGDWLSSAVEYRLGTLLEFSHDSICTMKLEESPETFIRRQRKAAWRRFPKAGTHDILLLDVLATWTLLIFRTYLEGMPLHGSPSEEEMLYIPARSEAGRVWEQADQPLILPEMLYIRARSEAGSEGSAQ